VAELLPSERLQPCLLDRLTDEKPETRREGREQRVISLRKYRAAVLRDVSWLLNAKSLSSVEDVSGFAEVERSVLNYGTPDLSGMTASGLEPEEVVVLLRKAIQDFEPRILANTLSVTPIAPSERFQGNVLSFEIQADLWAQPAHEALLIRTDLDLETGDFRF
jgi:type VI secretion system protein ImpF